MEIKGHKLTVRSVLNLVFGLLERIFSNRCFNLWKTIYINFRCLSFSQAIKFPIIVWGGVDIVSLMGSVKINSPVRCGMIKLGDRNHNEFVNTHKSRLFIDGEICFKGKIHIMNGYQISVQHGALLFFGEDIYLGENISIIAHCSIAIGSYSRIAYNTVMMDTDMHYSINTDTREINRNIIAISIGQSNWIGSGSRVMKGAVTPNWTIVTAGSFLNKDYTKMITENSIIGGQPAKLIKECQRRIFSIDNEKMLNKYFVDRPHSVKFVLGSEIDLDKFCKR